LGTRIIRGVDERDFHRAVARKLVRCGVPLRQAVVKAAAVRFRPFVMTSMAFLLGIAPLVLATGAGAENRRSIGTGAFGGVLAATVFGLVSSRWRFGSWRRWVGVAGVWG
jgi:Cu/Ag efflux pump CusA